MKTREDIKRIWLTKEAVWIEDLQGAIACERFEEYPRLRNASETQRQAFTEDFLGLHWEALDEDLSYEGFFHGSLQINIRPL